MHQWNVHQHQRHPQYLLNPKPFKTNIFFSFITQLAQQLCLAAKACRVMHKHTTPCSESHVTSKRRGKIEELSDVALLTLAFSSRTVRPLTAGRLGRGENLQRRVTV